MTVMCTPPECKTLALCDTVQYKSQDGHNLPLDTRRARFQFRSQLFAHNVCQLNLFVLTEPDVAPLHPVLLRSENGLRIRLSGRVVPKFLVCLVQQKIRVDPWVDFFKLKLFQHPLSRPMVWNLWISQSVELFLGHMSLELGSFEELQTVHGDVFSHLSFRPRSRLSSRPCSRPVLHQDTLKGAHVGGRRSRAVINAIHHHHGYYRLLPNCGCQVLPREHLLP